MAMMRPHSAGHLLRAGLVALLVGAAGAAGAASLADETDINDRLLVIAIANEIRKECDSISARFFTALGQINRLKAMARARGYTEAEIDAYVNNEAEEAKMRARRNAYLRANGAEPNDGPSLCALGESEIAKKSPIGSLLWAR